MARTRGKEKFKSEDAREALLDAGWETLMARGLAPGLDHVTLKEAIERSGVPRTTAYRVFDGPDGALSAFRMALLARLQYGLDTGPIFELVTEMLSESRHIIESDDGAAKADLFREMVRVTFNQRLDDLAAESTWRAYVSNLAALGYADSQAFEREAVDVGDRFVPLFGELGKLFGFRPKADLTWLGLANILIAAADGAALRTLEDPSFDSILFTGDPERPWNGGSVMALAMFVTWCEPDPDADAPAELHRWIDFGPQESPSA